MESDQTQTRTIRVGCSGWSYPHWRGLLYPTALPEDRWLAHYARLFDTVEINATFYRLPKEQAVARWAQIAPSGFCFAVKVSRYLTHVRRLLDVRDGVARLTDVLQPLAAAGKLGPMLWQLPPTMRRDDERLAVALEALPQGRHAFEFRHQTWFTADVYALLREHGVALVIADRAALPEAPRIDTAGWWYVRYHEGTRGRRGNYSAAELTLWATRLAALPGDIYAYFNNDWEGFAPRNALWLKRRLGV